LGSVAIFRCQGRIIACDQNTILRKWALLQANYSILILDLAEVAAIDAGGLGALLSLRAWTRSNGIDLRVMNVPHTIEQVFEVTNLDRVFEICSGRDLVDLLYRAGCLVPSSKPCLDQPRIVDQEVNSTVGAERVRNYSGRET
jgi:anti-anti-sigma factor